MTKLLVVVGEILGMVDRRVALIYLARRKKEQRIAYMIRADPTLNISQESRAVKLQIMCHYYILGFVVTKKQQLISCEASSDPSTVKSIDAALWWCDGGREGRSGGSPPSQQRSMKRSVVPKLLHL